MYAASLALACLLIAAEPHEKSNPVFEELLTKGVNPDDSRLKLPAPSLADGLKAADQTTVIKEVVGAYPYDKFKEKGPFSPQIIRMREVVKEPGMLVRGVDVWFIAYGDLETVARKEFLEGLAGGERGGGADAEGDALTAADLAEREIVIKPEAKEFEGYGHGTFKLLDKVKLTATGHTYWSRTDDSIVVAAMVDPRFKDDADFPNQWQSIMRGPGGAVIGPAEPYEGAGEYIKITRLAEPAGALFVEFHLVYAEPEGWFGGLGTLSSKLPAVFQNQVRAMRRELAEAQSAAGKPAGK
jgi:hypothetical protein